MRMIHRSNARLGSRLLSPRSIGAGLVLLGTCLGYGVEARSADIEWSAVPTRDVPVFFPGQGSWEWVMTEKDHSGAPKFREGKNCRGCHEGEEAEIGGRIASGEKLEPVPITGRTSALTLKVAMAHDADRLYVRLQWPTHASSVPAQDPDHVARITLMLDDGHVKEATRAGCWGACHDDAIGMASASDAVELTKYLGASRLKLSRSGGGSQFKSADEIEQLLQQGTFLEYWQALLVKEGSATAGSGYILERRHKQESTAVSTDATQANGQWTVILSRALVASQVGEKSLVPGNTYSVGFALHDDHSEHRFHLVSFEHSLRLDEGDADFVARGH